jgi:hypothetical protein
MSSSNRKPWETSTVLDQALLDASQDNLAGGLEPIVEISAPDGSIIRASDRNKYVGEHFYEALTNFPVITRTLGDWLSGGVEFSELEFELSNVDGRYNRFLPGGADFAGWVGRSVTVKIGLREQESTYTTVFRGRITREAGFGRTVKSVTIRARDELERAFGTKFPLTVFSDTVYPLAAQDLWSTLIPVIYGDWTVDVTPGSASIPAWPVNAASIFVNNEELNVQVTAGSPATLTYVNHRLSNGQVVNLDGSSIPAGMTAGDKTVINATFNTFQLSGENASANGEVTIKKPIATAPTNLDCVISENANEAFDTTNVYILRLDKRYRVPVARIVNVNANKNRFEIQQDNADFQIEGENWKFDKSDKVLVRVRGKNLGAYDGNAIAIARDILETYGDVDPGDFDSSWNSLRDKASPAESAIANIKARAWVREEQDVLAFVKSLISQVRVELFVDRDLQLKLFPLHFDAWVASPSFIIRNWDCEKGSFAPRIDDRNNFNRARAAYNFLPDVGENAYTTKYQRNQAAITQAGEAVTRAVLYPNLQVEQDAKNQLRETLKIASSYREVIGVSLTSRAFLQDVGGFVRVQVNIGSSIIDGVPCLIRELGYDPGSLKIPVRLWSFQMVPFGSWNPGYAGTVGGQTATITEE